MRNPCKWAEKQCRALDVLWDDCAADYRSASVLLCESNLRWELVKRTFSFSPPNLFISQMDVRAETCWVGGRYVPPQFPTALKMWWLCELVLPLCSLGCGKVSMSSSLIPLCSHYHIWTKPHSNTWTSIRQHPSWCWWLMLCYVH